MSCGLSFAIERRIHLQVAHDITCEARGRGVARAALKVDLGAPDFVEIICISEDDLVPEIPMNRSGNELVMLGVIPASIYGCGST